MFRFLRCIGAGLNEVANIFNKFILKIWSRILFLIVCLWLFGTSLVFFGIGLAFYLDELLESTYKGFIIVGSMFLGLSIISFAIYKLIWFLSEE